MLLSNDDTAHDDDNNWCGELLYQQWSPKNKEGGILVPIVYYVADVAQGPGTRNNSKPTANWQQQQSTTTTPHPSRATRQKSLWNPAAYFNSTRNLAKSFFFRKTCSEEGVSARHLKARGVEAQTLSFAIKTDTCYIMLKNTGGTKLVHNTVWQIP